MLGSLLVARQEREERIMSPSRLRRLEVQLATRSLWEKSKKLERIEK